MAATHNKERERGHGRYAITGAGVLHVRASEILKTKQAKDQLAALKNIAVVDRVKVSKPV